MVSFDPTNLSLAKQYAGAVERMQQTMSLLKSQPDDDQHLYF